MGMESTASGFVRQRQQQQHHMVGNLFAHVVAQPAVAATELCSSTLVSTAATGTSTCRARKAASQEFAGGNVFLRAVVSRVRGRLRAHQRQLLMLAGSAYTPMTITRRKHQWPRDTHGRDVISSLLRR